MSAQHPIDSLLAPEGWVFASSQPVDADDPGRFHALFGRDSLIFALQVLPVRPEVATATLRTLASLVGRVEDPETEEEPGRIVHEYRPVAPDWLVEAGWPVRDGELRYYGTSDANAWWLVVLDATGDTALQAELAEARRAVSGWLEGALARGGGFVRCGPRLYPGGLDQQGWRDTHDAATAHHGGGIVHPELTAPAPPLADVDSQAAAVAGLDALTRLDPEQAEHWAGLRDDLRARLAALPLDTLAVEPDGTPVPGAGSQLGWLLWAGAAADPDAAAERLTQPDVLTSYGVRTLSVDAPGFLVHGYHRGAVWPFDCWLAWGGLLRVGRAEEAERIRAGVRAALAQTGVYPELYAVTPDDELRPLPIANKVQAWTLGAAVAFDADWTGQRPTSLDA